jgi:hypothetical protein
VTEAERQKLEALQSAHPGCVWRETKEAGLLVVRRPTSDEAMAVEDVVAHIADPTARLDPFAGVDLVASLVVHPSKDKVEELMEEYAAFFNQIVTLMRVAACGGGSAPEIELAELRDEEIYAKELPADRDGNHPKRHGGRVLAVEHVRVDYDKDSGKPTRTIIGRYLLRRFGRIEHQEHTKLVNGPGGFTDHRGERTPKHAVLAQVARSHLVKVLGADASGRQAPPGCNDPDFEKHPYLLVTLGMAVRDSSRLTDVTGK